MSKVNTLQHFGNICLGPTPGFFTFTLWKYDFLPHGGADPSGRKPLFLKPHTYHFCNTLQHFGYILGPEVSFLKYLTTLLLHFGVKSEHLTALWQHLSGSDPWFLDFYFVKVWFPTPRRRGPLWSETFISEASYLSLLQYLTTLWVHFGSRSELFEIPYNTFTTFRCQKWTPYSTLATCVWVRPLVSLRLLCESMISYPTEARTPLVGNLYFWSLIPITFALPYNTFGYILGSRKCNVNCLYMSIARVQLVVPMLGLYTRRSNKYDKNIIKIRQN